MSYSKRRGLRLHGRSVKYRNMYGTRTRVCLALLVTFAFALRLAFCSATTGLGRSLGAHFQEYILAGQRLLEHGTIVCPMILENSSTTPSALMPPLYVGLVAAVYRVLGTETFAAMLALQLINAAATSLTVALVFLIVSRIGGPTAGWVAAGIATINPTLIGFTTYVWDTSVFSLAVAFTVYLSLRLSERPPGRRGWLGFGLYLGGLALLNPALTITYPFLVLWPLTRSHGWRLKRMLGPVAMILCGWGIAITPWTVRNYVHFGELMYIRCGFAMEVWIGVCPEADAHGAAVYRKQFPLLNPDVQRTLASIGEQAYIRECGERARAAIAADPWRLVRLTGIRVVDYWAGTIYSHARPGGGGWPGSTARAAVLVFLSAEVLLIVVCLVILRRLDRDLAWLLAIVLTFSFVYCLTHVQVRYRVPTEPIMACLVAVLVTRVCRVWTARGASSTVADQPLDDPAP